MTGESLSAGPVRPFPINVPEAALEDLRARLRATRWPEAETVADWSQGAPLSAMRALCADWAERYDWRPVEAELNAAGGSVIEIAGLDLHFLHQPSPHASARPLILLHGWPGGVIEFLDAIPRLTDPTAFGGAAEDAFHIVAPALPGFGFSAKPTETGWGLERIADACDALMRALGYERYLAQGGDWGSEVVMLLVDRHPQTCLGAHLNFVSAPPPEAVIAAPTPEEAEALKELRARRASELGYLHQQGTKPQTLGYALTDSPAGQAAWIYEKFHTWTDRAPAAPPEDAVRRDRILDIITLYWLTASATSSARLYWESIRASGRAPVAAPVACSIFPRESIRPSRRWAETRFKDIRHWSVPPSGGHFAALEQPALFAEEVAAGARALWRP